MASKHLVVASAVFVALLAMALVRPLSGGAPVPAAPVASHQPVTPAAGGRGAGPGMTGWRPPGLLDGAAAAPAYRKVSRPRSFTVLGSGDVLLHPGLWQQARADARATGRPGYDFGPLLSGVAPAVTAADLAICHLETPLGRPGGPFSGYPLFNVPPQIAPALRATGYDECSTASNHTIDQGETGVRRTLDALDAAGIRHAGSARTAREATTPTILAVPAGAAAAAGAVVRVAHLSYTFGLNGLRRPAGKEWLANLLDVRAVRAEARRARAAGAEVVIVSVHWGTEYQHAPDALERRVAGELLRSSDVDLILGHHAHVVQPFERIGAGWVAYGLGNHVAWQSVRQGTRDGVLARFTLTEVAPGRFRVTRAEALPTLIWLGPGPARVLDLSRTLPDSRLPAAVCRECQASWQRTAVQLRSRGAGAAGLVVAGGR